MKTIILILLLIPSIAFGERLFVGKTVSGVQWDSSGAPTTGCYDVSDLSVDSDGVLWYVTVSGCPGTWVAAGSVAPGVLLADGSVAMTGDLDVGGFDLINAAGVASLETLASNVDGLVGDVGTLQDDVGDLVTNLGTAEGNISDLTASVTTIVETPQCSSMPFIYRDGSDNDFDTTYWQLEAADYQVYRVVTSNDADQDLEVGECFCVPDSASAFDATSAITLTYRLSDGTGGNELKLRVKGTDGTTCFTSSAGVETSETVITADADDLSTCVKTPGGLICVSALIYLDAADTASVGLITLKMVE